MQETELQLILNKITTAQESTITMNAGELYLAPDTAVYSVNNVAPVNGNVTISIPAEVTETTVSNWGFTKNVGTVTKVNNVSPVNGNVTLSIPTVDQTYNSSSANAQSGVAIAGAGFLKNASTGTNGLIIGGTASNKGYVTVIGNGASGYYASVVVGQGASSTANYSTVIGQGADSTQQFGVAIGQAAQARSTSAIQLGTGTNTDSNTLSVGFSDAATNYQLLDGTTGLIPDARISTNIQRTLVSGTSIKTVNSTSLLGSGDIDTSEIFIATYGTTTISQISQALSQGKTPLCYKGDASNPSIDYFYYYSGHSEELSAYTFSRVYQNTTEVVYLSSITNQWNTITKTLANNDLSNVSSIDSSSAVQTALDGKADTTLSNVSSIDSGSAVQTALDGKVSKSGDTMTGALNIAENTGATFGEGINLISNAITQSVIPAQNLYSPYIVFKDTNENELGYIYYRQGANSTKRVNIACRNADGSDTAYLVVGFNADGSKYSSFPNTPCVDGQWVAVSSAELLRNATAPTSDLPAIDVSSYLPNDSYNYELLIVGAVTTGASSGNQTRIILQSSIMTEYIYVVSAQTRASSAVTAYGNCILPVGSDRNVYVMGYSSNTGSVSVYLKGYRRIGTNS